MLTLEYTNYFPAPQLQLSTFQTADELNLQGVSTFHVLVFSSTEHENTFFDMYMVVMTTNCCKASPSYAGD